MSNLGFSSLRLVNPYHAAFGEARSAVGATDVLEQATLHETLADAVEDAVLVVGTASAGARHLHQTLRRLESGARFIRKALAEGPVALVFGSEKFGLSTEDMSHCHWLMRIPTREEHESMNLGQAVAVCLYELVRNPKGPDPRPTRSDPATARDLELLYERLEEVLDVSGYMSPRTSVSSRQKLRRLLRRTAVTGDDVQIWLGILRQIRWKLRSG